MQEININRLSLSVSDIQTPTDGFTLVANAFGVGGAGEVSAPTPLTAQGRPDWMPDAAVLGVATGPLIPPGWRGGAFMIMPGGDPFDWTTADGTPSNTLFFSKNVVQGPGPDWMAAFSRGAVGTYNPATNEVELGYGGLVVLRPGGVPIAGFLNIRGDPPEDFTGTISANAGGIISLDQAAARALGGLAPLLAAIPTPPTVGAAAGMAKASAFLQAIGRGGNVYAGAAVRVEARFVDGELEGLYRRGQRIVDFEGFVNDLVGDEQRYRPPVIPNMGIPEIANYNYTVQMAFGSSPWDLAATSGGLNHGNGAIAVANDWRESIRGVGLANLTRLPEDVRDIVLFGPRSMAEAGRAVNALLAVVPQDVGTDMIGRLSNPYDLDFGVPAVKFANELRNSGNQRPGDYQFVRNVFEGDYRYPADNPDTVFDVPGGGGLRLF